MMHLLLGVRRDSDGLRLLRLALSRYGRYGDYRMEFCYDAEPPSRIKERAGMLAEARTRLEAVWLEQPGVIIGLGWMACELLTGRGKTKLKEMTGTRWTYVGDVARSVWVTYDPTACLYDPALMVDIAAVLVAAGKEIGFSMSVVKNDAVSSMNKIWQRYL